MRKYEKRQEISCLKLDIKKEARKEIRRIEKRLKRICWLRFGKRILLRIELIHFEKVLLSTKFK